MCGRPFLLHCITQHLMTDERIKYLLGMDECINELVYSFIQPTLLYAFQWQLLCCKCWGFKDTWNIPDLKMNKQTKTP